MRATGDSGCGTADEMTVVSGRGCSRDCQPVTLNRPACHLQIKSCENLADLFTKSLPNSTFQKYVHGIGMRRLRDLQVSGGVSS